MRERKRCLAQMIHRTQARTSVRIDLGALEENYRAIARLLQAPVTLLCVIKADAYGHGAVRGGAPARVPRGGIFRGRDRRRGEGASGRRDSRADPRAWRRDAVGAVRGPRRVRPDVRCRQVRDAGEDRGVQGRQAPEGAFEDRYGHGQARLRGRRPGRSVSQAQGIAGGRDRRRDEPFPLVGDAGRQGPAAGGPFHGSAGAAEGKRDRARIQPHGEQRAPSAITRKPISTW